MARFDRLLFGTAGIPLSTPDRNMVNGVAYLPELGLDGMEMEFVHSVNVSKEKAPLVKESAAEHGMTLTCHGSYYINLNAKEPEKVKASIGRIIDAATRAWEAGAFSMTFHSAFYLGQDSATVFATVKKHLSAIVAELKEQGVGIWVRPETTGKGTQFGTVEELLELSQEVEQVMPCIDFSHLHARSNGKYNSYEETSAVLEKVEKALGKKGLSQMHIHLSGIEYSAKGERNHVPLERSDLKYREILRAWKDYRIKGMVICESPNIEEDALLLKKTFQSL